MKRIRFQEKRSVLLKLVWTNAWILAKLGKSAQNLSIIVIIFCFSLFFRRNTLLAKKSVMALVREFNMQVGRRSWTSIRGLHDTALVDTLIAKGVDVSAVYDGCFISFDRKIKLNEDKTKIILA